MYMFCVIFTVPSSCAFLVLCVVALSVVIHVWIFFVVFVHVFFFFKQKTAYEMRISDWSSDVCLPISLETVPTHSNPFLSLRDAMRPPMTRRDFAASSEKLERAAWNTSASGAYRMG